MKTTKTTIIKPIVLIRKTYVDIGHLRHLLVQFDLIVNKKLHTLSVAIELAAYFFPPHIHTSLFSITIFLQLDCLPCFSHRPHTRFYYKTIYRSFFSLEANIVAPLYSYFDFVRKKSGNE